MQAGNDPMGHAIADYFATGRAGRLRVFSPMFDEDEIPVATLFRTCDEMPAVEQEALDTASGAILDVGAGAGCHALALQAMEKQVTAIDISPLAVQTMRERGVKDVREQDFFTLDGKFDTILMLMNGIGIVGTLSRLPAFFMQVDRLLAPGGQLLCDSSDICYIFEDEEGCSTSRSRANPSPGFSSTLKPCENTPLPMVSTAISSCVAPITTIWPASPATREIR